MIRTPTLVLVLLGLLLPLAGCRDTMPVLRNTVAAVRDQPLPTIQEATAAYEAGEVEEAWHMSRRIAAVSDHPDRYSAAFIAGLSAMAIDEPDDAEHYLRRAAQAPDDELAGDALATLGLMFSEAGDFEQAQEALMQAGQRLQGEDRARAHFFAAAAQQKLGYWPQARTNLLVARALTQDPTLRQQATELLSVTGYTVQTGAFSDPQRAQEAASQVAGPAASMRLGPPRLVSDTGPQGQPITRVQVGQFASYQAAIAARGRMGVNTAIVVPIREATPEGL
jgi:tetratricopeptide (TPR) repeat protein